MKVRMFSGKINFDQIEPGAILEITYLIIIFSSKNSL